MTFFEFLRAMAALGLNNNDVESFGLARSSSRARESGRHRRSRCMLRPRRKAKSFRSHDSRNSGKRHGTSTSSGSDSELHDEHSTNSDESYSTSSTSRERTCIGDETADSRDDRGRLARSKRLGQSRKAGVGAVRRKRQSIPQAQKKSSPRHGEGCKRGERRSDSSEVGQDRDYGKQDTRKARRQRPDAGASAQNRCVRSRCHAAAHQTST